MALAAGISNRENVVLAWLRVLIVDLFEKFLIAALKAGSNTIGLAREFLELLPLAAHGVFIAEVFSLVIFSHVIDGLIDVDTFSQLRIRFEAFIT